MQGVGSARGKAFAGMLLVALVVAAASLSASAVTTLNFWVVDYNDAAYKNLVEEIIPAFHAAYPNIKVEVQRSAWNVYQDQFIAGWAAGVGPDVFNAGPHWLGGMAERGLARPIDDYVERWEEAADFFPISWEAVTWNGKKYGIPHTQSTWSLIYRADVFDQSGLDTDAFPATWDELYDILPKLSRTAGDGTALQLAMEVPNGGPGMFHWWVALLYQAGGKYVTDDGHSPAFNTPEGLEASEFYIRVYDRLQGFGTRAPNMGLVNGNVAIQYANPAWFIPAARVNAPDTIQHYRTSEPLTGKRKVALTYTNMMAMSSLTQHPDEAWELLKWLGRVDSLVGYNEAMSLPPPRISALQSNYVQSMPIIQYELLEVLPHATPWPSHHGGNQAVLRDKWPSVLNRTITPQQALQDAANAWINW